MSTYLYFGTPSWMYLWRGGASDAVSVFVERNETLVGTASRTLTLASAVWDRIALSPLEDV